MSLPSPSSSETLAPIPSKPDPETPPPASTLPPATPIETLNQPPTIIPPPAPPAAPSFTPTFRPFAAAPQYTTVPNPNIQPPGVSAPPMSVTQMMPPGNMYVAPPGMPPPYGSNGYMFPPPGVPRYPGPYQVMMRPGFPMRPMPPVGVMPQIPRLPMPGVRPMLPMVTPMRPSVPILPPAEKPQTTVYVGKIAPTVDNDFLLSLLRICGPVKSWKRAQDPSDGKPKGFGFCEFEAAEGVLRALRLLSKLNIDGQELVLNINQATRDYLERYVEKKTEREKEKLKETEDNSVDVNEGIPSEKEIPQKPVLDEDNKDTDEAGEKGNQDIHTFGIVSDEDREVDKDASEKITNMLEERLKTHPCPPPPPIPAPTDGPAKSNSEVPSKSKDGDSDIDIMKSEEKNDEETTSENKPVDHDKLELSSPDRRRHDRRGGREKDRERDLKREKERELVRFERERERERVKRERDRELRMREAERVYKERMKDWEAREREKEYQRQHEKDREKDRLRERRKEIIRDEEGTDEDEDDLRKRRRRGNMIEDRRRKRLREKEEDLFDRLNEEDEIAEAKKRKIEDPKANQESEPMLSQVSKESENPKIKEEEMVVECAEVSFEHAQGAISDTVDNGEMNLGSAAMLEIKQNDGPVRKLGFGLVGSGKRTTVPSVFHQEEDEDIDEKKMRPLVPIDYSNEELQAVKETVTTAIPNIVAAAEFAKRISSNPKEEKIEFEKERNGRYDRFSRRDRDRSEYESAHSRSETKEKMHDKVTEREDKMKSENRKLLDAKQLIDMIPKTKDELFAYDINWSIYDKHALHERMRPWISKKITEFLGEEEATLVDYIVSSTKEHVKASKMLELLQSILDDEAEMFVLKMWRMLIFEVKKVETGLSVKSKA